MVIQDDREQGQRLTHVWIVAGRDKFMSGWGKATGGVSYAGWACKSEDRERVLDWVRNRGDMKNVKMHLDPWKPTGKGHAHIYVVNEGHPALR
jgi:hypothetical protein